MNDVYQAANSRLHQIFQDFEHVYIALSGGKDSGVLTHLVADYMRKHCPERRATIVFIDLEGSYQRTEDFVRQIIAECMDVMDAMWVCLPMRSMNSVSMHEPWWTFWEPSKQARWIRPMPQDVCVINSTNNPFEFFHDQITFEQFIEKFGDWLALKKGGRVASLVGIRTQESLNRWRAIFRTDKGTFNALNYSVKKSEVCYNFYPIHDWTHEDIWTYNGKFNKSYNTTYDLFYKAGVPLSKMRICEPFGDEQKAGLNMFKVIEPDTWVRLLDRVSGVNFGSIYCGTQLLGMRGANLPPGHTWKSYCKFLLKTLPEQARRTYTSRFVDFLKWWHRKGSPCMPEHIVMLPPNLIKNAGRTTKRGKGDKDVIRFRRIADELPGLDTKSDFPTWKRMCITILKNDITCKSLHFGLTKYDLEKRKAALKKYANL
jgi:predicted phosphoadenosine phosphosulfate sulfurtransferase